MGKLSIQNRSRLPPGAVFSFCGEVIGVFPRAYRGALFADALCQALFMLQGADKCGHPRAWRVNKLDRDYLLADVVGVVSRLAAPSSRRYSGTLDRSSTATAAFSAPMSFNAEKALTMR